MPIGLSLRVAGIDWNSLSRMLFTPDGNENAAVLLCGQSIVGANHRLLVRHVVGVPADDYVERHPYHLEVAPRFYNRIVDRCLQERLTPVICHSHPFDGPARYSLSDDFGETRLLPVLESLLPGLKPVSLLLTRTSLACRSLQDSTFVSFGNVTITGRRVRALEAPQTALRPGEGFYDRQIRAFGEEGQRTLESLTAAVVGLGGIGSLVAEQLVRAGLGKLILVDFDTVEPSNLSRLFGGRPSSLGKPKVHVVAEHLSSIRPVQIDTVCDSAVKQSVLNRLRVADLILACVDSDLARTVISRLGYQYLIPVVDMGIRLDARKGRVTAAAGRVSVVGPDWSCLRCGHHVSPERIRAESLPVAERRWLAREGYVMGIEEPVPAVVTLNCAVAGLGATAALNLFVDLTGSLQHTSQIYDATAGIVFTASSVHEPGCDICDPADGVKGLGDLQVVSAYD